MPPGADFCSDACAEAFAEWAERQLRWDLEHELVEEPELRGRDSDEASDAGDASG